MKMTPFTLRPDESSQAGLLRIAGGMVGVALQHARHPGSDPVERVHLFRTTTKRLRALLQLIRPTIARTAFQRENARLKRIADRLAPFRDRAVMIETLKALGQPASILRQRNPVAGHRERALQRAARDLEEARDRLQKLHLRGAGWEVIGPGLMRVYRQARRRMKTATASQGGREFHRWRIRVKQLYYQLQWLQVVWPQRLAGAIKRLHQLEELLGSDHDLVSLIELLKQAPRSADGGTAIGAALQAAARRSGQLRRASERLGMKVFHESPRRFHRGCERHCRAWEKKAGTGRTRSARQWSKAGQRRA